MDFEKFATVRFYSLFSFVLRTDGGSGDIFFRGTIETRKLECSNRRLRLFDIVVV